jgi:hypothetical protein
MLGDRRSSAELGRPILAPNYNLRELPIDCFCDNIANPCVVSVQVGSHHQGMGQRFRNRCGQGAFKVEHRSAQDPQRSIVGMTRHEDSYVPTRHRAITQPPAG